MNTGSQATINVTPLIDILLVLLIIFMVITPLASHGLQAQLPQPPDGPPVSEPPPALRAEKTVFVQGAASLEYGPVARLIDAAMGAGASRVALLTDPAAASR